MLPTVIARTLYGREHEAFRGELRTFLQAQVTPRLDEFRQQGRVDRGLWQRMGAAGYLCMSLPKEVGGGGRDFRYNALLAKRWHASG